MQHETAEAKARLDHELEILEALRSQNLALVRQIEKLQADIDATQTTNTELEEELTEAFAQVNTRLVMSSLCVWVFVL